MPECTWMSRVGREIFRIKSYEKRYRYHGSRGTGLLYLNVKKPSLELISDEIAVLGHPPLFEDVDKDGVAEIFVQGGGWNRTGTSGAAWLHWRDDTYKLWWPDWTSPPYVMQAELADVDNDQQKEIIAVLDTEGQPGRESHLRALGVWTLNNDAFTLVDKVKLPNGEGIGWPMISQILPTPHGTQIDLRWYKNAKTLKCIYLNGKITCSETESR